MGKGYELSLLGIEGSNNSYSLSIVNVYIKYIKWLGCLPTLNLLRDMYYNPWRKIHDQKLDPRNIFKVQLCRKSYDNFIFIKHFWNDLFKFVCT